MPLAVDYQAGIENAWSNVRQVLARSKYDPSDILAKLVFWTIMVLVLQLAFGVFGANPVSDLLRGLIAYLPNVFVAILVFAVFAALDQLQIAPRIVTGLRTMQRYWERAAGRAESRGPELRDQVRASADLGDGRTRTTP
jgi:hypothetical protein